jgi:hypothetical protein
MIRGRAVDNVDAASGKRLGKDDCIVNRPADIDAIDCGNAHKQRFVMRPFGARSFNQIKRKSNPVLDASAVAVVALVGKRREERV